MSATCQTFNCPGIAGCPFPPLAKGCLPGLWYTDEQRARFIANHPGVAPPPQGWVPGGYKRAS